MLKNVVLLGILGVLGYFGWQHFFGKEEELTIEQRIDRVAGGGVVSATELAALSVADAAGVRRALKGRRVQVEGRLARVLVKGVESDDLIFEFDGAGGCKVDVVSDFGKLARITPELQQPELRFLKVGRDVHLVGGGGGKGRGAAEGQVPAMGMTTTTVVFTEGKRVKLPGMFHHADQLKVKLDMQEIPAWLVELINPQVAGGGGGK